MLSAPNGSYYQDNELRSLQTYSTDYVDYCQMGDIPGAEFEDKGFDYYQSEEPYFLPSQPESQCTCGTLPVPVVSSLPSSQIVSSLPPSHIYTYPDTTLAPSFASMSLVPSAQNLISLYGRQSDETSFTFLKEVAADVSKSVVSLGMSKGLHADYQQQEIPEREEMWTFEFPQELCGRLIGKGGRNIKSIKEQTGADLVVLKHGSHNSTRLLKVSGLKSRVLQAITIIEGKFSGLYLRRMNNIKPVPVFSIKNENVNVSQLQLPDSEGTDCIISSILDAGHFYVQIATTATQTLLNTLQNEMNKCYDPSGQGRHIPGLPWPPVVGTYCTVHKDGGWFRAQVVKPIQITREVEILYVDYGSCETVTFSTLRQLR